MADPATALPRRGRHGVGCRSRIGTPRCEQRSRWPFRRLHCRRRCHSPRRSQRYPSPVFRRPTRRRLRGQALSSLTRGLKQPVTQWCSGSGPCASCAAPLSWPRSSVHPDNEVSIHRRFFHDERSTPCAPTSSRRQPPVEVLARRVCLHLSSGISPQSDMRKKPPKRPAKNAQAISRWEGEGGARRSPSEEERETREARAKEERLPRYTGPRRKTE